LASRDVLAVDCRRELWRVEVIGAIPPALRIWAAPTMVRDMVVITMLREDTFAEPAITALRKSDGSQVWQATDAAGIKNEWGSIRSSVAAVGDLLVYGEPYSDRLVAVDIETGETAWDVQTGAYCFPHWPSPAVVSGQVIIARHDGALYAVDVETQTQVWEIYLGNDAGTFPADFEDPGFCEWAPRTGYSILASPAVAANGFIVVGTLEGYLVAISDRSW
jgi:outer membrane protein assembly factor BamB